MLQGAWNALSWKHSQQDASPLNRRARSLWRGILEQLHLLRVFSKVKSRCSQFSWCMENGEQGNSPLFVLQRASYLHINWFSLPIMKWFQDSFCCSLGDSVHVMLTKPVIIKPHTSVCSLFLAQRTYIYIFACRHELYLWRQALDETPVRSNFEGPGRESECESK